MKKLLSFAFLLMFSGTVATAQLSTLATDAKNYTNANIVTNLTRAITPQKLNIAVNKIIDALFYIDTAGRFQMDTALVNILINDSADVLRTAIGLRALKSTTLNINGTTQDLSNNRTYTVGNVKPYNLLDNGGDPTGAVDVGAQINTALAAGNKFIYLPAGTWLISTQVNLKDSVTIFGDGRFRTFIKQTGNITALKGSYALGGKGSTIRDIGFYGNSTGSSQIGIMIDSAQNFLISNCSFSNYGGYGIQIEKNATLGVGYPSAAGRGHVITGCYFTGNNKGLRLGSRAEYCSISNCHFTDNFTGLENDGGNNSFSGVIVEYNTVWGVTMTYISNSGHGNWVGGSINHNGTSATNSGNLYMLNQSLGFSFSGVDIGAGATTVGKIELSGCSDIVFEGGFYVAGDTIRTTGCSGVVFSNVNDLAGSAVWVNVSGTPPTVLRAGKVSNALSFKDVVNNKQADIIHTDGKFSIVQNGSPSAIKVGAGLTLPDSTLHVAGGAKINGGINLGSSTASRPLKTDASKNITSGSIDLSNNNDVTGTVSYANGGTGNTVAPDAGYFAVGDGTKYVPTALADLGILLNGTVNSLSASTYLNSSDHDVDFEIQYPFSGGLILAGSSQSYKWSIGDYEGDNFGSITGYPSSEHIDYSAGASGHQFVAGNIRAAQPAIIGDYSVAPHESSILELKSTTQGLLLPRMTKAQRDAISNPTEGLMIYQTDNSRGLRVYNGSNWVRFAEEVD